MPSLFVGQREYMFTTLALKVAGAVDVKWVPPDLTSPVVGVSMEGPYHESEALSPGTLPNTTVLQRCVESTPNIIGTSNI